jgi:hypothetical protein
MNLRNIVGMVVIPIMSALFLSGAMAAIAFDTAGCTPAQQAVLGQVEQIILDDLAMGKTLTAIEADVARVFAGQTGVDIVLIVDEAIVLLIDAGLIPAGVLPYAQKIAAEVHPVALAHRAAVKQ